MSNNLLFIRRKIDMIYMRFQLKCSMGRMECYKRYAYHVGKYSRPTPRLTYREYFMESAGVRYLRRSCWRIRNRTSERSERVRLLIQKQRVGKYRTKHFPLGIVFIIYVLRHSSFWRPFYFKSFKNAKICRYTLTAKWQRKRSIRFFVKTFVKNINDGENMR